MLRRGSDGRSCPLLCLRQIRNVSQSHERNNEYGQQAHDVLLEYSVLSPPMSAPTKTSECGLSQSAGFRESIFNVAGAVLVVVEETHFDHFDMRIIGIALIYQWVTKSAAKRCRRVRSACGQWLARPPSCVQKPQMQRRKAGQDLCIRR